MEYRYFFFYSDKRERWISCKEDTCIEMDNKGFQVKMVIYDKKSGKPFTGDLDIYQILDAKTGKVASPEVTAKVMQELKHGPAQVQHDAHMDWVFDHAKQQFVRIDDKIRQSHSPEGGKPLIVIGPVGNVSSAWYTGGPRSAPPPTPAKSLAPAPPLKSAPPLSSPKLPKEVGTSVPHRGPFPVYKGYDYGD